MLDVVDLSKTFRVRSGGAVHAVRAASFSVNQGEVFTFLGPSGCGKTTLLRMIAGLESPDSGGIVIDGQTAFSSSENLNVAANRRRLGMVFQSYAIWPHMSVFKNTAFPLESQRRRLGLNRRQIRDRVERVLEVVSLEGMMERDASNLSGGQQQRLALARAIVAEPKIILLDEPLSNLDATLRERMRSELRRLQREIGITMIYVTHDQTEALALSNTIAVMNEGQIVQIGDPVTIYNRPEHDFVARFVGKNNIISGRALKWKPDGKCIEVSTDFGTLQVRSGNESEAGAPVHVAIRPEKVRVNSAETGLNSVSATIVSLEYLGTAQQVTLRRGNTDLVVMVAADQQLERGSEMSVFLDPDACTIVD